LPKQITTTAIIIELSEDSVISEFLNHQKKGTKNTYSSMFRRLKEFCDTTGQEMLDNPELWKKKIFEFKNYLIELNYSEYYAQTATSMIRGFFDYYEKPLKFRRADRRRLAERNRKTEDYPFDKADMAKLAMHADLKSKYVLLVGKSVGLRAGDFVNFTYGKFRGVKLDSDAPIFIGETVTKKERVKAFPFLDSDAIPIVKEILEANKDRPDSEYILMTKSKKKRNSFNRMQPDNLSTILQSLAKKAKIQHGSKRIRFHCLRKYLSDRLSSAMSESKWKQVVGKKISEGAYISANSLREDYLRAMPNIVISSNGNGKIKKDLEDTKQSVETMAEIIASQKAEIERLKAEMASKSDTDSMRKMMFNLTERLKVLEAEEQKRKEAERKKPETVDYT